MTRSMLALGLAVALSAPAAAFAGGPGVWTKIAPTESGFDQAGIVRTADNTLHLVTRVRNADGKFTYNAYAISLTGKLLGSAPALAGWETLEGDPRLLLDGSGIRLVFIGGQDTDHNNFNSVGAVYTETSPDGTAWTLVHGSMAQHTVTNLGLGAVNDANGTPVAAFGLNSTLYFHQGVDPDAPASSPDGSFDSGENSGLFGNALARDTDGSIWMAWYQKFGGKEGYWVDQILPTMGNPAMAPGQVTSSQNNEPVQQVAFAARAGGGTYMAYCARSSTQACAHISLWRAGSPAAMTVPGSASGGAIRVALAPQPDGRMWVAWFDYQRNVLHAVRTNAAATRFGAVRTIKKPPVNIAQFGALQGEGTSGRLDLLANVLPNDGTPNAFWHTQVLAPLTLTVKPAKFSHIKAKTVTLAVTDAGTPVSGATVSCLGKSGKTGAAGTLKLTYPKGANTGKHGCSAAKAGYYGGKATLKVT